MDDEELRKYVDDLKSDPLLVNFCVNQSYVGHMYLPSVPRMGEHFLASLNGALSPSKMRIKEVIYIPGMKSVTVEGVPIG